MDDLTRRAFAVLVAAYTEANTRADATPTAETATELLDVGEALVQAGACPHGVILGPCVRCGSNTTTLGQA